MLYLQLHRLIYKLMWQYKILTDRITGTMPISHCRRVVRHLCGTCSDLLSARIAGRSMTLQAMMMLKMDSDTGCSAIEGMGVASRESSQMFK